MSKKKKPQLGNKEKATIRGRTISNEAFEVPESGSTDHMQPVFTFNDTCPNHFQLHDWQYEELKHLTEKLRDLSKKTWAEIKSVKGFMIVDQKNFSRNLPEYISQDATIYECRISKRARLFGHRARNVFCIIWFDRNHEVYPM
jgi:hypothetical protein